MDQSLALVAGQTVATAAPAADEATWYKDAIIYQLHVKAFYDSDGDGIGDFKGLTEKLDYVQSLGVNTIWLLPFYPSPLRDDGYDIAEYFDVHPQYGTLRDVREFVREAHRRGLRVITELVINHTSDQHPWFQAARAAPKGSRKRDFYVWSDTYKKYEGTRIIFTDTETSNWTWDNVAQQYFWHRFFSHQPDLNFDNPEVLKAVLRVMRFWLDMGIDGLRLDAIPYLCEREGTNNENLPETHVVLKKIRAALDARYKNRMLLAEANQWPEDVRPYFGDGDECHMAFHFPLMPRIYMAVAQEDRHPIVEILDQTPDVPPDCQWAIFLRNHDELTLEMVTDRERDYLYQVYASDPRMRINLGIRRRLASLVDNDIDRIKLMNNLLLSMPGSPVIYYGDEIGMGDNIYVTDRNGVRTPMQWSPDRNAGFSRADPARLYLPPIMDAVYGYTAVNVESQTRDPSSLLNWMRRIIAVRNAHHAFGRGTLRFLKPGNRKILAYLREYEGEAMLCVTNLSRAAQAVELDLVEFKGRVPVEMLGRTPFPPVGQAPYMLTLPGYGFFWFRLAVDAEVPSWHTEYPSILDLPVLVMFAGWQTVFPDGSAAIEPSQRPLADKQRQVLESRLLPAFLQLQRWFADKGTEIERVCFGAHVEWRRGNSDWLLSTVQAHFKDGGRADYFMPLAIAWEGAEDERVRLLGHQPIARVRRGARPGILLDALADEQFGTALFEALREARALPFGDGRLGFYPSAAFGAHDPHAELPARMLGAEQSNTSVILGDRAILKAYRKLHVGTNPEIEMGLYLTEGSPFAHVPPVLGHVVFEAANGDPTVLALVQAYVPNLGDGWRYTQDYLTRYLQRCQGQPGCDNLQEEAGQAIFMTLMRGLGVRTGELHKALLAPTANVDFAPEVVEANEIGQWVARVEQEAETTFAALAEARERLVPELGAQVESLIGRRAALASLCREAALAGAHTVKSRYHGDYHLGQVLVVNNDFVIIDFEGEPGRTLAERRRKHSPLKDVAGMLRSFDYAAFSALKSLTLERPEDLPQLEPYTQRWEAQVARLFLEGYAEAVRDTPLDLALPQAQALMRLFQIEKALYEIRYELANRPDWLAIPVLGLLALLDNASP